MYDNVYVKNCIYDEICAVQYVHIYIYVKLYFKYYIETYQLYIILQNDFLRQNGIENFGGGN